MVFLLVVSLGMSERLKGQPVVADIQAYAPEYGIFPSFQVVQARAAHRSSGISIDWEVLNETGVAGYQLDRRLVPYTPPRENALRAHSPSWEPVLFVLQEGVSVARNTYTYLDSLVVEDTLAVVYRLSRIMTDGRSEQAAVIHAGKPTPRSFYARAVRREGDRRVVLEYGLPVRGHVKVTVSRVNSPFLRTLVRKTQDPGWYEAAFEYGDVEAGLYIGRIQAGTDIWIEPLVLVE